MTSTETSLASPGGSSAWPVLPRLAARFVRARAAGFRTGSIAVTLPDGTVVRHKGDSEGPHAELVLHRWRVLWRILAEGDLGLAHSYIDGDCDSPDIKAVLTFGALNPETLDDAVPPSWVARWIDRLRHLRRTNSRRGSRRNIAAHYDLGNAFYEGWLDRGMNYSSGIYRDHLQDLEQAQEEKLRRVIALLDPEPGSRVLEIGCGWGALAERLVRDCGNAVTGITLSTEQLSYARQRLADAAAAELRLQDYRDVGERYDRVVSIEMFEAVGERYWPVYFRKLRQCIADDGLAVLQVITIAPERFEAYRRQPDFIQRYIFPGGMLPTVELFELRASEAGFRLTGYEEFGASYARTLGEWRSRFLRAWPAIERIGFDLRFKRMWEYYLVYCEVGFEHRLLNVGLFRLRPAVA